jgi:outer membrane protein
MKEEPEAVADTFYTYALTHRYEMLLAEKNERVADWNYKIALSRNNPTLSLLGGAGFKNGYISDINSLKFNYNVGLSLNVPLFDSNRKHISKQIANSSVTDSKFETESVRNKISDEVTENYEALQLAVKKIDQFTSQLEWAKEAYEHAETNYNAGVITNLDLLDASNALAESRLLLLRSDIDYKFNLIKFKSSLGKYLY